MNQHGCVKCGGGLSASEIRHGKKTCGACLMHKGLTTFQSEEYITTSLFRLWSRRLYHELIRFLNGHDMSLYSKFRMLPKAMHFFQEAERVFEQPGDMSREQIEKIVHRQGKTFPATIFQAFLAKELGIEGPSKDEKLAGTLKASIEGLPQAYRRLVEVVTNERMALREKQIKQKASHPLALSTIRSDVEVLSRLVRWLTTHQPNLTSWDMVQEEHIHAYLLTLMPKHRELVRKDLHMFFRLARKRRMITHVPITDLPSRELPQTVEPLKADEQKVLVRLLRQSMVTHPVEAFLTTLCFYYGLSSSQIRTLKVNSVNAERHLIYVEDRPPVYLMEEDLVLLEQFLRKRQELPYARSRSHLFISGNATLRDEPVSKRFVSIKVRNFSRHTPQCLRITCLTIAVEQYGPQYLVEAFGLSLTQAARYGNMREFLVEEEAKQQREGFQELSRRLE